MPDVRIGIRCRIEFLGIFIVHVVDLLGWPLGEIYKICTGVIIVDEALLLRVG